MWPLGGWGPPGGMGAAAAATAARSMPATAAAAAAAASGARAVARARRPCAVWVHVRARVAIGTTAQPLCEHALRTALRGLQSHGGA
eukprot:6909225-Prymnesium_polylepis.1